MKEPCRWALTGAFEPKDVAFENGAALDAWVLSFNKDRICYVPVFGLWMAPPLQSCQHLRYWTASGGEVACKIFRASLDASCTRADA